VVGQRHVAVAVADGAGAERAERVALGVGQRDRQRADVRLEVLDLIFFVVGSFVWWRVFVVRACVRVCARML
jgi:hypothetical protein